MPRDYRESQFYDEPKIHRSIWITPVTWDWLDAIAKSKGYSRSELIEQAARQGVAFKDVSSAAETISPLPLSTLLRIQLEQQQARRSDP